jgi:hypothetical protein
MQSNLRRLVPITAIAAGVMSMAVSPVADAAATGAGWSHSRPLATNVHHRWGSNQIVVDGRGDAAMVWQDNYAGFAHLRVATRDAGKPWSASRLLTFNGTPGDAQGASVGIGGRGRTVVVWTDVRRNKLLWAQHRPGGAWSPTRAVPNQPTYGGTFTMSTTGWGVLAYEYNENVYVRKLTPNSVWQAPVRVSAEKPPRGDYVSNEHAAIGTDGSVVAAWDIAHPDNTVQADIPHALRGGLTSSGVREPVVNIWPSQNDQSFLTFFHSASGNAVAVTGGSDFVFRLADGVWRSHQVPATPGATRTSFWDLALTDSEASLYWSIEKPAATQTLYVSDFANGTWSGPQVVHAFAPHQFMVSAEAARTTTQRVVAWTAESTPNEATSISVHVRITVGGKTYDRTLAPESYDLSVAATGNHAGVAFSRVNGKHNGMESLFALTR